MTWSEDEAGDRSSRMTTPETSLTTLVVTARCYFSPTQSLLWNFLKIVAKLQNSPIWLHKCSKWSRFMFITGWRKKYIWTIQLLLWLLLSPVIWLLKEIQKGKNTIITDAIINKNQLFKTMGWHDSHAEKSTENESRSLKMLHFSLLITVF